MLFGGHSTSNVQHCVCVLYVPVQKLNCLLRRDDDKFDSAPDRLAPDFVHNGQRPACPGPYHQTAAAPWYVLCKGEWSVAKLASQFFGRFLLALVDIPVLNHYIVVIIDPINPN